MGTLFRVLTSPMYLLNGLDKIIHTEVLLLSMFFTHFNQIHDFRLIIFYTITFYTLVPHEILIKIFMWVRLRV